MMSSTLGAPLGGTTCGGHQGLESLAFGLITPPNFCGGGGSCLPSRVVVEAGEPGTPVVWISAAPSGRARAAETSTAPRRTFLLSFIIFDLYFAALSKPRRILFALSIAIHALFLFELL